MSSLKKPDSVSSETSKNPPLLATNNPPPPRGAWGYVWLAVGSVMLVILGIWIYSLPQRLSISAWQKTGEYKLLKQAQDRWGKNFTTSAQQLIDSIDTSELSQALQRLDASSTPSTTVSSTTTPAPTTTTTPGTTSTSTLISSSSLSATSTRVRSTSNP
jgi:heme exporter protein D